MNSISTIHTSPKPIVIRKTEKALANKEKHLKKIVVLKSLQLETSSLHGIRRTLAQIGNLLRRLPLSISLHLLKRSNAKITQMLKQRNFTFCVDDLNVRRLETALSLLNKQLIGTYNITK
ncbi:MAG: hypothetical protein SP4CHLAM5_06080 [Chlamydiia bacterium]|nr:hypothetical protein [Chlamydiia bacterium]MCH9618477.1 hypothetical protein [Chlamydiia bacterium]